MKTLEEILHNYPWPITSPEQVERYEHYLSRAAKLTTSRYMGIHNRITAAFGDQTIDTVLFYLSHWVHIAEKESNPGLSFNLNFKRYRERRGLVTAQ